MTSLHTLGKIALGVALGAAFLAGCDRRPADQPASPSASPESATPTPSSPGSTTPEMNAVGG